MTTEVRDSIAGRFLIARGDSIPADDRVFALSGGWSIAFGNDLSLIEVRNGGVLVGWLIGIIVDLEAGTMLEEALVLDVARSTEAEWQAICVRCAGSWLYIVLDGDELEFRPDSCATLGLVYEPETGRAAAYAYQLVGASYDARLNQAEREVNGVNGDGWFTGGLTAHHGVFRLLPNHAVSTRDFAMRRLPLVLPAYDDEVNSTVDAIALEIDRVVSAVTRQRPTEMGLTGGNETRALLAAVRRQLANLRFVTIGFETSALDVHLSQRLASRFGFRHDVLAQKRADEAAQAVWTLGAGHAMAGNNKDFWPSLEPLAGHFMIGGLGGEVGRGFLWPQDLAAGDDVSPEFILGRLKQPLSPANLEAVTQWRNALPDDLDAFQILDLAYLELRMGPWAFAQPRMAKVPRSIHPLISYNQFARMWSIPPAMRKADRMIRILIERNWPELLEVPINKYGDWRDAWQKASKAVRRPDKFVRKMRQVLSSQNKSGAA